MDFDLFVAAAIVWATTILVENFELQFLFAGAAAVVEAIWSVVLKFFLKGTQPQQRQSN